MNKYRNSDHCAICGRKIDIDKEVYYSLDLNELMPEKQPDETTIDTILTNEVLACLCKKCVIIKNMFNAIPPQNEI
jgi:hypothetical protein